LKRRIVIKEYQNCINIEIKAKKQPVKIVIAFLIAAGCAVLFFTAKKYAFIVPWALLQTGTVYYVLWLFFERTTISVFPEYIMVVHNYLFLDITGKFFQRDAVTGLKKNADGKGIVFEYMSRPETLIAGLTSEETAFIMKFLVFSLNNPEFKKTKR
jgi:hypothetical protein